MKHLILAIKNALHQKCDFEAFNFKKLHQRKFKTNGKVKVLCWYVGNREYHSNERKQAFLLTNEGQRHFCDKLYTISRDTKRQYPILGELWCHCKPNIISDYEAFNIRYKMLYIGNLIFSIRFKYLHQRKFKTNGKVKVLCWYVGNREYHSNERKQAFLLTNEGQRHFCDKLYTISRDTKRQYPILVEPIHVRLRMFGPESPGTRGSLTPVINPRVTLTLKWPCCYGLTGVRLAIQSMPRLSQVRGQGWFSGQAVLGRPCTPM